MSVTKAIYFHSITLAKNAMLVAVTTNGMETMIKNTPITIGVNISGSVSLFFQWSQKINGRFFSFSDLFHFNENRTTFLN